MNKTRKEIVHELKRLIEKRIIKIEPKVGLNSWICIVKSIPLDKGQSYYKIGQTGRLETYLAKTEKRTIVFKRYRSIGHKGLGWCIVFY